MSRSRRPVSPAAVRYLPFAAYMLFIGVEQLIRSLIERGTLPLAHEQLLYLYPLKILVVVGLLYSFRHQYHELRWRDLQQLPVTLLVSLVGLLVFVLWINLDWVFQTSTAPHGYNPTLLPQAFQLPMTAVRIAGAALVVPVMEELFWRSFLIRSIENQQFETVPIGHFSWTSFLITVVLFGLEHHLVVAGMVAGIFYNLVLYRTRSLAQCVLAHGITNLVLALYVLNSGRWEFW